MSKVVHRKPVWGWSVVLLSTLLLSSPVTAAALLHAIAHASATAPNPTGPGAAQTPRRAEGEEVSQTASGELPLRLDTLPGSVAVLVASRALLLVPDEAAPGPAPAFSTDAPVSSAPAATPSRAPPLS